MCEEMVYDQVMEGEGGGMGYHPEAVAGKGNSAQKEVV